MLKVVSLVLLQFGLALSYVPCPDGGECPDGSTCCKTFIGYGCCPYPLAVCCSDKFHCCPNGYSCDTGMCHRLGVRTPLLRKVPAMPGGLSPPDPAASEPKMDKQGECCANSGSSGGGSGSCCPVGFRCDEHHACVREEGQWYPRTELRTELRTERRPSPGAGSQAVTVTFCDRKMYCPVNNTCCKNHSHQWACCPYPLGQCCLDSMHCCPYGYICDRRSTSCIKEYASSPAAPQQLAKRR